MPLSLVVEVRQGAWMWSFWLCLAYSWSDVFLCSASIVHMSVISLDRYLGISKPLRMRSRSWRLVALKITFVWLMTIVISLPLIAIAISDRTNVLRGNTCAISNRYYMIYGSTLSFLIPLIIMAVTYWKTTKLLNQQAAELSLKAADPQHNGLRRTTMMHRKLGQTRTCSYGFDRQASNFGSETLKAVHGGRRDSAVSAARSSPFITAVTPTPSIVVTNPQQQPEPASPSTPPLNSLPLPPPHGSHLWKVTSEGLQGLFSRAGRSHSVRTMRLLFQKTKKHQNSQQTSASYEAASFDAIESTNVILAARENGAGLTGLGANHKLSSGQSRQRPSITIRQQLGRIKSQTSMDQSGNYTHQTTGQCLLTMPALVLMTISGKSQSALMQFSNKELANEHKATRVLAVVFACFFVCWTPFFLLNFTLGFCGEGCASIPEWASSLFLWLGYISSTLNPLIYTTFNRRFRQAFLRILRCHCCVRTAFREQSSRQSRSHTYIAGDPLSCSYGDRSKFAFRGSYGTRSWSEWEREENKERRERRDPLAFFFLRHGRIVEGERATAPEPCSPRTLAIPNAYRQLSVGRVGEVAENPPPPPNPGRRASLAASQSDSPVALPPRAKGVRGRLSLGIIRSPIARRTGWSRNMKIVRQEAAPEIRPTGLLRRLPLAKSSSGLLATKRTLECNINRVEEEDGTEEPSLAGRSRGRILTETKKTLSDSLERRKSATPLSLQVALRDKNPTHRWQESRGKLEVIAHREALSISDVCCSSHARSNGRGIDSNANSSDESASTSGFEESPRYNLLRGETRAALFTSMEVPLIIAQGWLSHRPEGWRAARSESGPIPQRKNDESLEKGERGEEEEADTIEHSSKQEPGGTRHIKVDGLLSVEETTI